MGRKATVATTCLNQWALDFEGNLNRILISIEDAKRMGARYRTGPELEITWVYFCWKLESKEISLNFHYLSFMCVAVVTAARTISTKVTHVCTAGKFLHVFWCIPCAWISWSTLGCPLCTKMWRTIVAWPFWTSNSNRWLIKSLFSKHNQGYSFPFIRKILLIRPKKILCDDGNYRESRWFTEWKKVGFCYFSRTFLKLLNFYVIMICVFPYRKDL